MSSFATHTLFHGKLRLPPNFAEALFSISLGIKIMHECYLTEKPSGMRDTCTSVADEVTFGKEISKSVKCFFKKHKRFGCMTLLQCVKNRRTVIRNSTENGFSHTEEKS